MPGVTRRDVAKFAVGTALAGSLTAGARAQDKGDGKPIRIGHSMPLTGGLAGNGRSALLAEQIWASEVNAKGGLLGRPVELVYYDDQSNPSQVPGIYTKLLDVDKVDLAISSYGTAVIAAAMPLIMERRFAFVTLLGTMTNEKFRYDRYANISPVGGKVPEELAKGFFDVAMTANPKPTSVAIAGLDSEFPQKAMESARYQANKQKLQIVYDRAYPPGTVDFSPVIRSIQAARPDLVFLASYPPDSAGLIRTISEVRLKATVLGGTMIGPQVTALKLQLGPLLNNIVCWDVYVPEPTMQFPGIDAFLTRYREAAQREGIETLGLYTPPLAYARMQVLARAVELAGGLDQAAIGAALHKTSFDTIIGPLTFDELGEWTKERNLYVQYQDVKPNDAEQFRKPGTQVILYPPQYKSGELRTPYAAD